MKGYKDQPGAGLREANTEVQFGSYFDCFERFDRVAIHRVVVFSKIAFLARVREKGMRLTLRFARCVRYQKLQDFHLSVGGVLVRVPPLRLGSQ